jgi:hypothetical protein
MNLSSTNFVRIRWGNQASSKNAQVGQVIMH